MRTSRDPRFALHGPTFHPEEGKEGDWPGEAKVAGRAVRIGPVTAPGDEGPDGDLFTADITEVVVTGLDATASRLVIESWTPTGGSATGRTRLAELHESVGDDW